MSYQNPPTSIDEDETVDASVVVTTLLQPTSTTTSIHRSKLLVASVAGTMLVAGVVVLMQVESSYTTVPEGLVVGTERITQCFPATDTFSGVSTTTYWGKSYPFETCYQLGDTLTYCWTKSYRHHNNHYLQCFPDGLIGDDFWHAINPKYVNPWGSCGMPCQAMQEVDDDDGIPDNV